MDVVHEGQTTVSQWVLKTIFGLCSLGLSDVAFGRAIADMTVELLQLENVAASPTSIVYSQALAACESLQAHKNGDESLSAIIMAKTLPNLWTQTWHLASRRGP